MNRRIAKKLKKEMLSWTRADQPVRHKLSTFKKAWDIELQSAFRGEKWAKAGWEPKKVFSLTASFSGALHAAQEEPPRFPASAGNYC